MSKNTKIILTVGGIVIALLVLVAVFWWWIAGWSGIGWRFMGPGMMGGFGGGWFMAIVMIVISALFIWGIIAIVRGIDSHHSADSLQHTDSALEILKKRYASGELSKDEFEQKKKDLQ
jgi:putative membrane protein